MDRYKSSNFRLDSGLGLQSDDDLVLDAHAAMDAEPGAARMNDGQTNRKRPSELLQPKEAWFKILKKW